MYTPEITSFDNGAVITESGTITKNFIMLRDLFNIHYLSDHKKENTKKSIAFPPILINFQLHWSMVEIL